MQICSFTSSGLHTTHFLEHARLHFRSVQCSVVLENLLSMFQVWLSGQWAKLHPDWKATRLRSSKVSNTWTLSTKSRCPKCQTSKPQSVTSKPQTRKQRRKCECFSYVGALSWKMPRTSSMTGVKVLSHVLLLQIISEKPGLLMMLAGMS